MTMIDTIEQILRREEELVHAKQALDIEALDRLYVDDLLMSGVMGEPTCSKGAIIDEVKRGVAERESAIASGRQITLSAENQDMKVATHGDTAITNYRFVVNIKGEGMDVQHRYRTTNVWMKRDGQWQIVAAHMAFVLDPRQAATLSSQGRKP
jgi:ketosteroid isomerase-like protein